MRQITNNVYKFDELTEDIQTKVIEKFRESIDYPFLTEDLTEECKRLLEEYDITIIDKLRLYYSLSSNQGDGCMFEGIFTWDKYNVNIKQSGHYYHYNSKVIDMELIEDDFDDELDDNQIAIPETQFKNDERDFNDIYVSICKQLEKYGYNNIEYEDSDETITDMINSNDYEFYDDGEIV